MSKADAQSAALACLLFLLVLAPTSESSAAPTGACCFNDGRCLTTLPAKCEKNFGIYKGDGTRCDVDVCPLVVGTTVASVGGGGAGESVVSTGVWDFDNLSASQRDELTNCENTVFHPFGDELETFGWAPSLDSNVPGQVEWIEPGSLATSTAGEVGGGVLSFYDKSTNGFCAGQRTYMESPQISLRLGPADAVAWDVAFQTISTRAFRASELVFVVGSRSCVEGRWTRWTSAERTIKSGQQQHRHPVSIVRGATDAQIRIGVENRANAAVADKGPLLDGIFFSWKKPLENVIWKWVPDISQQGQPICEASAFANCLSYWSENGYPELAPSTGTPEEKQLAMQRELKNYIHDQDMGDAGATKYLKAKGVFRGQKQPVGRQPLDHKALWRDKANWWDLRTEFEQCHDVILRLLWYDAEGNVIKDRDGNIPAHYVTVAGFEDGPDMKRSLRVANPWGDSHHDPGVFTQDDDYDKLEVTVLEGGKIRVDNADLEQNAASIPEGADHLCVDVINVIAPVAGGNRSFESDMETAAETSAETDAQTDPESEPASSIESEPRINRASGLVDYTYAPVNSLSAPLSCFAVLLEVPFEEVTTPHGWSWQPLPADNPGSDECNRRIGPAGILWTTTTNPITPGGSLEGFGFAASASFLASRTGVIAYMQTEELEGTWSLVRGPVSLISTPTEPRTRAYAVPNPARSSVEVRFTPREAGPVRVEIFDASGRVVRSFIDADVRNGERAIAWDGKDNQGRLAPAGVYACRLRSRSDSIRCLFVWAR